MGFLQLLPASKLSATYNALTGWLTLYASGTLPSGAMAGAHFFRVTWLGGLKYELKGWVGPITGEAQDYEHKQVEHVGIGLPHVDPSMTVIFVTLNHPEGQVVKIQYELMESNGSTSDNTTPAPGSSTLPAHTSGTTAQQAAPFARSLNRKILVAQGEEFQVQQSSNVNLGGSVGIDFEEKYLNLETAGIENMGGFTSNPSSNIVWTFKALEPGKTQVVVTVSGGIAQFVMTETYDVTIIPLDLHQ